MMTNSSETPVFAITPSDVRLIVVVALAAILFRIVLIAYATGLFNRTT